MQLGDVGFGKRAHAAFVSVKIGKESALVVIANGERRYARYGNDVGDAVCRITIATGRTFEADSVDLFGIVHGSPYAWVLGREIRKQTIALELL